MGNQMLSRQNQLDTGYMKPQVGGMGSIPRIEAAPQIPMSPNPGLISGMVGGMPSAPPPIMNAAPPMPDPNMGAVKPPKMRTGGAVEGETFSDPYEATKQKRLNMA